MGSVVGLWHGGSELTAQTPRSCKGPGDHVFNGDPAQGGHFWDRDLERGGVRELWICTSLSPSPSCDAALALRRGGAEDLGLHFPLPMDCSNL